MKEATASKVTTDSTRNVMANLWKRALETTLFSACAALTLTTTDLERLVLMKQNRLEMGRSC